MKLPALTARQLAALLKRAGFVQTHQRGSHLNLWNAQTRRGTVVPMHPGDVKPELVRKILFEDCGLTQQQVRKLL